MDVCYVNARVRGMYSHLFDQTALKSLIGKPDLSALINALGESPYRDDIASACTGTQTLACVERGLRANLAKTFQKLTELVSDGRGATYLAIYLWRWDAQNLHTILRGKHIRADTAVIRSALAPPGHLGEEVLSALLKEPDVRGVIDLLATFHEALFAEPLTAALPEYAQTRSTAVLEASLDHHLAESALSLLSGTGTDEEAFRAFLKAEIDATNIRTAMMTAANGVDTADAMKFVVPGGTLPPAVISRMFNAHDLTGVISALEGTRFAPLTRLRMPGGGVPPPSRYERFLELGLVHEGITLFRLHPFSLVLPVGFLMLKENEVTNLRIIARCKVAGMPADELEEEIRYGERSRRDGT